MSHSYYEYFDWLCLLVRAHEQDLYWDEVLWALYATEFVYRHPKDSNREEDGLALRDEFWANFGPSGGIRERFEAEIGGCTVLEMLIGLAEAGENDIMHDPDLGDRSSEWFWMMIFNLGLDQFAYRGALDVVENQEIFEEITGYFSRKKCPKNVPPDIFGLKIEKKELLRMELWDQMCMFFNRFF